MTAKTTRRSSGRIRLSAVLADSGGSPVPHAEPAKKKGDPPQCKVQCYSPRITRSPSNHQTRRNQQNPIVSPASHQRQRPALSSSQVAKAGTTVTWNDTIRKDSKSNRDGGHRYPVSPAEQRRRRSSLQQDDAPITSAAGSPRKQTCRYSTQQDTIKSPRNDSGDQRRLHPQSPDCTSRQQRRSTASATTRGNDCDSRNQNHPHQQSPRTQGRRRSLKHGPSSSSTGHERNQSLHQSSSHGPRRRRSTSKVESTTTTSPGISATRSQLSHSVESRKDFPTTHKTTGNDSTPNECHHRHQQQHQHSTSTRQRGRCPSKHQNTSTNTTTASGNERNESLSSPPSSSRRPRRRQSLQKSSGSDASRRCGKPSIENKNIPMIPKQTSAQKETRQPSPGKTGVTPRYLLDSMMRSSGYSCRRYKSLETAYHNRPTELQEASYHSHLLDLIESRDLARLGAILTSGVSPNPCNARGESLVHLASRRGDSELLEMLLQCGATVQLADESGRTPLHEACLAREPSFDTIDIIIRNDIRLFYMMDGHEVLPLSYVRKPMWGRWTRFLESRKDIILEGDFKGPPPLTLQEADTRPQPEPENALTPQMAQLVVSGKMKPQVAQFLRQTEDDDSEDSDSDGSDSYSDSYSDDDESSEEEEDDDDCTFLTGDDTNCDEQSTAAWSLWGELASRKRNWRVSSDFAVVDL